jgi:peptide/nickel transport system ATP-binding protein/oligopeptide transport system ATP-binding protein
MTANGATKLIEVTDLEMHFPLRQGIILQKQVGAVRAVDGITFDVYEGETLGLVGESGCGKSTTARLLTRLLEPTGGQIVYKGEDIAHSSRAVLKPLRRDMQMIFQDPYSSLNPRKTVGSIIGEPFIIHRLERDDDKRKKLVQELMDRVGLNPEHYNRFPHEFSGGQRQRIGIARALAMEPRIIMLDEPVSALDVSIQAQVVNLLEDLQDEFGLSYVFVAHDLSVVRHVSERIVVMYLGKIVEVSPSVELYDKPIHPYTSALLSAIPIPDPRENRARVRDVVGGEPPSPIDPPSGCRFHTRCPFATDVCKQVEPPLTEYPNGHLAACHHPRNVSAEDLQAATRSDASPLAAGDELPQAA